MAKDCDELKQVASKSQVTVEFAQLLQMVGGGGGRKDLKHLQALATAVAPVLGAIVA